MVRHFYFNLFTLAVSWEKYLFRERKTVKTDLFRKLSLSNVFLSTDCITLCILVDFTIHIDTISMGLPYVNTRKRIFILLLYMGKSIRIQRVYLMAAMP